MGCPATRYGAWLLWAAFTGFMAGCVTNPVAIADLDPAFHRCQVQPVFDNSCATLACHGDVRRPFHVFTRNRLRLVGPDTDRNLPLTEAEMAANFDNARGFAADTPEQSWLLLKPLEQSAGGYFHIGKERFGGADVWTSTEEAGYQQVLAWLRGAKEDPECVALGSL